MMPVFKKTSQLFMLACSVSILSACTLFFGNTTEIKILWADWEPARALEKISKEFEAETGIKVKIIRKSWEGAFTEAAFTEFRNHDDNFDIIIGDSQWLGLGVVGGHYLELTNWIQNNVPVSEIIPAALKGYCEFPQGSARYWAVPCEADAMGWVYRKDLFEDSIHQKKFVAFLLKNQINLFPLEPPKTWEQLRWIAAYFKDSSPGFVGVAMPTSRKYDLATMSFEQILWAFGGEFGDYSKNRVTIQSPEAVEALQYFKDLLQATTPAGRNMGLGEVMAQFISGRAAMASTFFAFFPTISNPSANPDYFDKVGYFNSPSHKGSDGVTRKGVSLGGQGMSINAHISEKRQLIAKQYLSWFSKQETQRKWAVQGGISANRVVLTSSTFLSAAPYHSLYEEAFSTMSDFWSNPEYEDLLQVTQREICKVIQQDTPPLEAVQAIQSDHTRILAEKRWKIK